MLNAVYLTDIRRTYRNYRSLAERAIAQVTDEQLHRPLDADDNSIAVVMRHVAGNLRSRFTDFLTTDGEKPTRNRDAEFEAPSGDRAALLANWNDAWDTVLRELDALTPDDLERTVHIRFEPFAVVEALNRSATHTAYHVGQIVFLAKHFAGAGWTSLSIPKGKSAEFSTGTFKQGIVPK
ncbi:MAG: DUF1572 family protein [Vicinamibacterales bacterium]